MMNLLKRLAWVAGLTIAATSFSSAGGPLEDYRAALMDLRIGVSDIVGGFVDPIFEDLIKALKRR